jgi:hypothetical protein
VRRLLVIVLATWACAGHSPEVKPGTGGGSATSHAGTGSAGKGSAAQPVTLPDVGCLSPSCAFHAGAGAHFTCLAGGNGVCFHFGAACTPADGCMYDPGDRTYKTCAKPVEGTCMQWAAACAPKSACMFSPDDGLYHHCDDISGGTCKRYGALCAP